MVLDTNILVAYLKGEPEVVAALEQWRQEVKKLIRLEAIEQPA
jgi:predicted nucleic acid-binding protein